MNNKTTSLCSTGIDIAEDYHNIIDAEVIKAAIRFAEEQS